MNNLQFAPYTNEPISELVYNVSFSNDMGHENFSIKDTNGNSVSSSIVSDYCYKVLCKKYITTYYESGCRFFRLKPGLSKKYTYKFISQGYIYVLNMHWYA